MSDGLKTEAGKEERDDFASQIARLKAELEREKLTCKRYRLAAESATNLIYEWDLGSGLDWLGNVDAFLGYQPNEIPRTWDGYTSLFHPEDRDRVLAAIEKQLKSEEPYSVECRVRRKDGTYLYWQDRGSVVRDESGKPLKWLGAITDITARKQAEIALRESEERYRLLVETLPDGVVVHSQGRVVFANPAGAAILGAAGPADLIGKPVIEFVHPDYRELALKRIQQSIREGRPASLAEEKFIRLDGTSIYVEISAFPFHYAGNPVMLTVFNDISERKRAEGDLRRMNAFLDSIVENIPNMIFLKDARELRFVRFNRAGEDLLGYSREDMLGKSDYDFFPKEQADLFTGRDREVLRGKALVETQEESIQTRHKGARTLHTQKVPILDASGEPEYLLGISEDITERKRAEEQVLISLREKDVLLQEIHHRVKNNMQVISSLFNLQAGHAGYEKYRGIFKEAQTRIRSMSLVHEKLYQSGHFSRIDFGGYIKSLAVHLVQVYRPQRGLIRLETDFDEVTLDISSAMPCGLLLNELISNALKHAFPDNRAGVVRIGLKRGPGGRIEIRVADDGIGLPADLDFRKAESFGLQIVNLLVGQLDASIELDRSNGTAFTVTFRELEYASRT